MAGRWPGSRYIYIYIYIYRERESDRLMCGAFVNGGAVARLKVRKKEIDE